MTSLKQCDANQRNAQGSTGPTSAQGKAASRMNALKSGLYAKSLVIPGESREEFDELVQQFNHQYRPATPQARVLVDMVIRQTWLLRRYDRIEGEEWALRFTRLEKHSLRPDGITPQSYELTCDFTVRIRKLADTAERAIIRALNKLDRLTEDFSEAVPEAVPAVQAAVPVENPVPAPEENGFVPSNTPAPAPEDRHVPFSDDRPSPEALAAFALAMFGPAKKCA
jgi:hypothetical protein